MLELVLDLRCLQGRPRDVSGHGNHGQGRVREAAAGRHAGGRSIAFNGLDDRVVILPSNSLSMLGGIRATAWIWVDELGGRSTILEGYLAFALFIESDGGLGGTVYNGFDWGGVRSAPGVVPVRQWINVTFVYDGLDTAALYLNGETVGHEFSRFGHVQGVQWPYGLNVGAWPDGNKRVFKGRIDQVRLWRSPAPMAAP